MTAVRGGVGVVVGVVLAPIIFLWSLIKGARAVHADGVVCTAEVVAVDAVVGPRLAGAALARFSGAFEREGAAAADILGLALRFGEDQDLILGTFESFVTASKDKARVVVGDYLANAYDTVAPWRVDGVGVVRLRIAAADPPRDPARGADRRGRLEADVAGGVAVVTIGHHANDGGGGGGGLVTPIAEVRLTALSPIAPAAIRISLGRGGRGLTAVGFRNGIRRVVYPVSQLGRRIRGG
jgi:hypothetical protein